MPQREHIPCGYVASPATSTAEPYVQLASASGGFVFTFEALRPGLFRSTFTSPHHPLPPHRAARIPDQDLPETSPPISNATSKSFTVSDVLASVDWKSGLPLVSLTLPGQETPTHSDLPNRAYAADGTGIAHYTKYNHGTLHLGLGEKPAPMDLSNRHFVLSATDSFGYDVHRTDPMYKHIPLLINATPNGCIGIFSTSHARGFYSVGSEMDGMWGRFKVYRQDYGGLEEYLLVGTTLQEVTRIYADLVGYPMLVPRWAFGYLAGGMKYSMLDAPRASDALMEFAGKLKKYDIPCSGFQMSSGYTVAETEPKTRNVFTWNQHRFPDPAAFIAAFHNEGIRLIANVKPYVLGNHPEYEKLKAAGAFFTDPSTSASAEARLWSAGGGESGVGGHIDFTSAAGYKWWYEGVQALKRLGIDCVWNDNNEYTIPHDGWQCELTEPAVLRDSSEHQRAIGFWGRALHTELMGKSSHDASLSIEPHQRPFVLTRSATAGTLRYCASAWSGDNVTSWDGMRGANALSLTAGMCLMQCYGHDIGGFEGPQPSPELLVRWCQQGIYSPRFAINCFKTSPDNNSIGDVIEPWMYEATTPLIRDIIKRRYELIPYLYSLSLASHQTATPPQRWTGWGYESDPEVWRNKTLTDGETQYWLGDAILVGGVFAPGADRARIYLPKAPSQDADLPFLDLNNAPQTYYPAGQWVDIPAPWTASIPVLAKVGTAIPVGRPAPVLSAGETTNPANLPLDDYRGVELFPPRGSSHGTVFANTWYEDDGVAPPPACIAVFQVNYQTTDEHVLVEFSKTLHPAFEPAWSCLEIILPAGDGRGVMVNDVRAQAAGMDGKRRMHFKVG